MNNLHPTLFPAAPALRPDLRQLIREQATIVRKYICPITAYPAAQSIIRRACADEAERTLALAELGRGCCDEAHETSGL